MATESKENNVVDGGNTMATEKLGLPCFPYIIILFSSENNRKIISANIGQIQLSKECFRNFPRYKNDNIVNFVLSRPLETN